MVGAGLSCQDKTTLNVTCGESVSCTALELRRRDNEITAANNKYLRFEQYNKVTAITSTAGLDALTAKYKGKGKDKEYSEHLRDQLRVRQHCYNITKSDLPKLGSGHGAAELARGLGQDMHFSRQKYIFQSKNTFFRANLPGKNAFFRIWQL